MEQPLSIIKHSNCLRIVQLGGRQPWVKTKTKTYSHFPSERERGIEIKISVPAGLAPI